MVAIRTIASHEVSDFRLALVRVFGGDIAEDPDGESRFRALVNLDQAWVADASVDTAASQIVGTAATFNLTIGIPGGTMPLAGLTMVTVSPTHRRRGILTKFIDAHLTDAKQRNYAISGLWASEAAIYRRFGFGLAAVHHSLTIEDTRHVRFTDGMPRDHVEPITTEAARATLLPVYLQATATRPGALVRSEPWWRERQFLEAAFVRAGASSRRFVVAKRGDAIVGYVSYRHRTAYHDFSNGRVEVTDLQALDLQAYATLWQFLCEMDLFRTVKQGNAPADAPLRWMVQDFRAVKASTADNVWIRINDVAAALRARRYATDGAIVLEVTDDKAPASHGKRWRLQVQQGTASCDATTSAPDITLDIAALGSLFMGSIRATELAAGGHVRGTPTALVRCEQLFAWPVAAWCPEVF